jgi:4-amino-4-deoxy-L-arabinose transferase-like glycosyltransferase
MRFKYLPLIYTIFALIVSLIPYLAQGYPLSDDSIHGLIRVKEYQLALANRQFPPYWAENLYGGFGSPIFLFYAPLYMFVAAIFYALTGSIIAGSMGTMCFFTVVSALGIYLLVKETLGEKSSVNDCAARVAVYFFVLNPYLIGDKFIRIANSEFAALCLAPISLYGLIKIKKEPLKGSLLLAAGLALVILAHNLTSLTIMAMLLGVVPILYWDRPWKKTWPFILGGVILGLLLSAFFWAPALYYKDLVHVEQLLAGGTDFHHHFKSVQTFFTSSSNISMGLLNLLVIIYAIMILWLTWNQEKSAILKLILCNLLFAFLLIFLQSETSLPLWEKIKYLSFFQFPWRMMGPLALIISVLAGLLLPIYCKKRHITSYVKLEFIILLLCIINTLPLLTAKLSVSESLNSRLTSIISGNDIKKIIFTTTEADEYLPKTAIMKLKHYGQENRSLLLDQGLYSTINVEKETGTEINFNIKTPAPLLIEIKRWSFPGWQCEINHSACLTNISSNGLIQVQTIAGDNNIHLTLNPPFIRKILTRISFAALLILAVLMSVQLKNHIKNILLKRPALTAPL